MTDDERFALFLGLALLAGAALGLAYELGRTDTPTRADVTRDMAAAGDRHGLVVLFGYAPADAAA